MDAVDSPETSGTVALWTRLWTSPAAREGLYVLASQAVSVGVSIGTDVILFRGLTQDQRGVLSATLALRAVLFFIADMGLSLTTVRVGAEYFGKGQAAEAAYVFRRMLWLRVLLGVAVAVIAALLAPVLARFPLDTPGRVHLIYAAALGLIAMAVIGWGIDVAKSERRFTSIFWQRVGEAAIRGISVVALVFSVSHVSALTAEAVMWALAGAALVMAAVSYLSQRASLAPAATLPLDAKARLAARIGVFNRYAAASELFLALGSYVDLFVLQVTRDSADTAVFDGARRLALLLPLLAGSLDTVLLPRAAVLTSAAECRAYLRKVLRVCVPLALLVAGGMALAASILVPLLWGERYAASVPPLRWLCIAYGLQIVLTPLALVLFPLRREGLLVGLNGLQLTLMLGLGLWLIPTHGPIGAAWAAVGVRIAMVVISAPVLLAALRRAESSQENA